MNATITCARDARLLELFAPEDKDFGRASYTVSEDGDSTVFRVRADDAVALRAALNAITKLLSLWERSEAL